VATPEERVRVRQLLNEPDDTNGWTDERIDQLLASSANPDGSFDFRAAGQIGWEEIAASYTSLVNISENGSSRSSSQQFDHAMAMAKMFGQGSTDDTGGSTLPRPFSGRIVRPTRG
jgi:hypothetical protein